MNVCDYVEDALEGNNKGYSKTEYGEPQVCLRMKSGRSVEITHEMNGLDEKSEYYSVRLHCSEKEFEDDTFHSTMGVIDSICTEKPDFMELCDALMILMEKYQEEWEEEESSSDEI